MLYYCHCEAEQLEDKQINAFKCAYKKRVKFRNEEVSMHTCTRARVHTHTHSIPVDRDDSQKH